MARRKKIGVFIGNTHTYFPRQLINSIFAAGNRDDIDLHFYLGLEYTQFMSQGTSAVENINYQYSTIYDYAFFASLDVVIIAYGTITTFHKIAIEEFYRKLKGVPCVIISDSVDPDKGVSVRTDNFSGIYKCTEHLIKDHGLRKILYISGPHTINTDARERLEAYKTCMKDNGLELKDDMIANGDYTEYVDELIEELLDRYNDAQAIVSANDEMTVSIYRVAAKRGYRIGKDLAVTGYDDVAAAEYQEPPLTTVRQNGYKMGREAIRQAINLVDGLEGENSVVPADFIQRSSCGCPQCKKEDHSPESLDLVSQYNSLKESYHRSLVGPYVIKMLIAFADDRKKFFEKAEEILLEHGALSSKIYLLPSVVVIDNPDEWRIPDTLSLQAFQEGDEIEVLDVPIEFTRENGSWMSDFFPSYKHRAFFNFLLFDGKRNYGVLECEIDSNQITEFYMISVQLGTAIHFLEISQEKVEFQKKLQEQNVLLNANASTDVLTGLLNRRGIYDRTVACLNGHEADHMIAFMVDLDHLKEINDTFGHAEGDNAIKVTGQVLKDSLGNRGFVGRYGGDEFLAIMPVREDDNKTEWIDRVKKAVRQKYDDYNDKSNKPYYVEMSVGAVELVGAEKMDFSQLIEKIDQDLYEAKKSRRKTVIRQ